MHHDISQTSHPHLPAEAGLLLEEIRDSVILLDASGDILYCNAALTERFGWPVTALIGYQITDAAHFAQEFRSVLLSNLEQHGSWVTESERLCADGSMRTVSARWRRLDAPMGAAAYVGIEQDITEALVRRQELLHSRKLAKIGILSEGIAHELRNPLSYALSAAQLLADDRIHEDVRAKCLQTIHTGLRKAGLIVENMLSLGKPNTNFSRARIRLTDVINEALDAASAHASYRLVSISQHFPEPGIAVWGNHDMLVQVFHNVISNALNEMPEGGRISITAEQLNSGIQVRVTDSGPGVTDEQLRHLFDPFFTASSSGRGTGLGLTLSYYIMKEHQGTIEVESHPGMGATFVLAFPLPEEHAEPSEA